MASILSWVSRGTDCLENHLIDYLDQVSDGKYDKKTLKDNLGLAKKALSKVLANDKIGTSEPVDPKIETAPRPATFSLPVAEQLVVVVGQLLQAGDHKLQTRDEE